MEEPEARTVTRPSADRGGGTTRFLSGSILLAGAGAVLVMAPLSMASAFGLGELFRFAYILAAAVAASTALRVAARRDEPDEPAVLRYPPLVAAMVLVGLGMLIQEVLPATDRPLGFLFGDFLFAIASVLGFWVILPALYRHLDRRHLAMTAFDGGILWAGGATMMLTLWEAGGTLDRPDQLLAPIFAAAMVASAGAGAAAAFAKRWAPAPRGIWFGIAGVMLLGLSWTQFVDSGLQGQSSGTIGCLLYACGVLTVSYGWSTWTDDTFEDERYDGFARRLGDWLPVAAVLVCISTTALPHTRMANLDVTWAGTMLVVLLTLGRQLVAIAGERAASQRLAGEERLRAEKDAAEASDRAKSEFLAMMSHEIRTPMNAILGNARLLAETPLSGDARESVEAIGIAGETLMSIISDILDFSKIEANRMQLERQGFSVADLVRSVVSLFMVPAQAKGLTVAARIDPALPEILAGDQHRLRQILFNLTGNAIKFTGHGGVTIHARLLESDAESSLLRFEVTDTGIGIGLPAQRRLFAPFVQADDSTTRRFGGTGLGLAISRSLVGLMGGEIGVDSAPGTGSTFWFTARLAAPTQVELMAAMTVHEEPAVSPDCAGARILVAEDNAANLRLVERLLERLGIVVVPAIDGRTAVDRALSEPIDLVLMDLHMPELDGLAATRAIRAGGLDIPIIALTADATPRDRAECLAAGMNDYLTKPIRQASLMTTLREWLPAAAEPRRNPDDGAPAADDDARTPEAADRRGAVPPHGTAEPESLEMAQVEELLRLDPKGEAGFLASMVDSYHATVAETMPAIRSAVERGDCKGLEEAAHKLKGVAGNIGAARIFETSARLVELARSGSLDGSAAALGDLESALVPAEDAFADLLAAFPVKSARPEAA